MIGKEGEEEHSGDTEEVAESGSGGDRLAGEREGGES